MPVGCKNDGEEDFFLINTCFLALSPLLIELLCFEMAEYFGHDLAGPVLTLPSVWACQGACVSHADCHFFTFDNATGRCILKGQSWANARAKAQSFTATSGERACLNEV